MKEREMRRWLQIGVFFAGAVFVLYWLIPDESGTHRADHTFNAERDIVQKYVQSEKKITPPAEERLPVDKESNDHNDAIAGYAEGESIAFGPEVNGSLAEENVEHGLIMEEAYDPGQSVTFGIEVDESKLHTAEEPVVAEEGFDAGHLITFGSEPVDENIGSDEAD